MNKEQMQVTYRFGHSQPPNSPLTHCVLCHEPWPCKAVQWWSDEEKALRVLAGEKPTWLEWGRLFTKGTGFGRYSEST